MTNTADVDVSGQDFVHALTAMESEAKAVSPR